MEKYLVNINVEKCNLKEYLFDELHFSSRKMKMLLKEKKIYINEKCAYWDSKIKNDDILYIDLSDRVNTEIIAQEIPLDIIYEDEDLLAVNKPPYLLVHPTTNHTQGTLANGLKSYFLNKGQNITIRFLNRLDMNTSGVIVVPKNSNTHRSLSEMMGNIKIQKTYVAVVKGEVNPKNAVIDKPIAKDESNHIKRVVSDNGKNAVTEYKVIQYTKEFSLLELTLMTGRTHQIRVHLSYIGYPIIGDDLYGTKSGLINRQALHASTMKFKHPNTDKTIIIHAPIPEDINILLKKMQK